LFVASCHDVEVSRYRPSKRSMAVEAWLEVDSAVR
jgi:hypothetical protein